VHKKFNLTYFAKIRKENDLYLVSFRDFNNIFSEGSTIEEAINHATEALDGVLLTMSEKDQRISLPSPSQKGEYPITVSIDVAAPIMLHIVRTMNHKTLTDAAKKLNVPYQQYQRLESNCNMTLKSLRNAAKALGFRAELCFYATS